MALNAQPCIVFYLFSYFDIPCKLCYNRVYYASVRAFVCSANFKKAINQVQLVLGKIKVQYWFT